MTDDRRNMPGVLLQSLMAVFIVTLPFSAVVNVGLLGNFDSNLALFPFALLFFGLLLSGWMSLALGLQSPCAQYIRWAVLYFSVCAVFTALNGVILSAEGISAYGHAPLSKSLKTMIVPLFLACLVVTSFTLAATVPAARLQRWIETSFVVFAVYAAWQILSDPVPILGNPPFQALLEGARGPVEQPYLQKYGRVNGPTLEAAEFAKTALLLFFPWFLFPAVGALRVWRLVAVFVMVGISQSLAGIITLGIVLISLLVSRRTEAFLRGALALGIILFVVLLPLFQDQIFGRIIGRLNAGGTDDSTLIRYTYNMVALKLVLQNPFIGLGWSNEIFFYPENISSIAGLWEVQKDIANGNALTAKSLMLRLMMYSGLPAFLVMVFATALIALGPSTGVGDNNSRLRLVFLMLAVSGTLDGGIITSFYLWVGPAFCLGFAARNAIWADTEPVLRPRAVQI